MSEQIVTREATAQELQFAQLWDLVIEIANRSHVTPLNTLPGVWFLKIDERWRLAVNGHPEPRRCEEMDATVPAFHLYVQFNGWPFAILTPMGGEIGCGKLANIETFSAALRRYLQVLP